MWSGVVLVVTFACGTPEVPELRLEGPSDVRVETLGPVEGPRVVLGDEGTPDGLIWTLSREGVARLAEGGRVVAEGPGDVVVVAEWEGERVVWTLHVELATLLAFVRPPTSLPVGETRVMAVTARVGESDTDPGRVRWTSSNPEVLAVDDAGTVTGHSPGVAYVTAQARGASAMVELEVTR